MPDWSAKSFANKHNQKLTGKGAEMAARIANGLVKKGMDEGKAIRIANAAGDKVQAKAKSGKK